MGVARVYRVGTPFNGVELADIDFEQTADTMYLAHIDHPLQKLVRQGHTNWTFSDVTIGPVIGVPDDVAVVATVANTDADNDGDAYFPLDASYVVTAVSDDDGTESRASDAVTATNDLTLKRNLNTVSWTAVTGATRYNVYKADSNQFYGYIGTTEDLEFIDANIGPALDKAPPEAYDPFPDAGNYPSTVTFFEQRLMLGRTKNDPAGIWGSRSGEYENFDKSRPLRDNDGLTFRVVAGRVNAVNQLVSTTSLLALTSDSVFVVDGDGQGGVLTANSLSARRQIGRGCSRLSPLVVDNVVFYAPSVGAGVRTINYSFELDGLKSNDVAIFAPHLFIGYSIVSWAYAQEPRSVVWAVRDDGVLLCFTWEQEQNVWGWTMCETDGFVHSVCSIAEDGEDRVYLVVTRDIGGVSRTFVERMGSHYWDDEDDACFLDCSVSATFQTPRQSFSNLWELEGATVSCVADGQVVNGLVIEDGAVTLPDEVGPVSRVRFGLPYTLEVETLPVRFQSQGTGWNIGRKEQAGQVVLSLLQSRNVWAGPSFDKLNLVKSRTTEGWGVRDAMMTGDYLFDTANHVSGATTVCIRQDDGLPFALQGVFLDPVS